MAKVLVDKVCEYVNVMERDYFSCTYTTAEGKVSVCDVWFYCIRDVGALSLIMMHILQISV